MTRWEGRRGKRGRAGVMGNGVDEIRRLSPAAWKGRNGINLRKTQVGGGDDVREFFRGTTCVGEIDGI
jgi:hypothetical protein